MAKLDIKTIKNLFSFNENDFQIAKDQLKNFNKNLGEKEAQKQFYEYIVGSKNFKPLLKKDKVKRVISFFSIKGGIGKTTLCMHAARLFALQGLKTLLIPLDSSCSMTDCFFEDIAESKKYDFFGDIIYKIGLNSSMPLDLGKTDIPTLDIIPEIFGIDQDIDDSVSRLMRRLSNKNITRENLISKIIVPRLLKIYDVILFDLPGEPPETFRCHSALSASTSLVIPVDTMTKTLRAFTGSIESTISFLPQGANYLLAVNRFRSNKSDKEFVENLKEFFGDNMLNTLLPLAQHRINQADDDLMSVFERFPNSTQSQIIIQFLLELYKKSKNKEIYA